MVRAFPLFWFVVVCLIMALDKSSVTRGIALTLTAAVVAAWIMMRVRTETTETKTRIKSVLEGLPLTRISDASLYGIQRTSRSYKNLKKNPRVMRMLDQFALLRKVDPHNFAIACTIADRLLFLSAYTRRTCKTQRHRPDITQLVLLKDRTVNTFAEYATMVGQVFLDDMDFNAKLRALDVVLYTEAIAQFARPQDAYPMGVISGKSSLNDRFVYGAA